MALKYNLIIILTKLGNSVRMLSMGENGDLTIDPLGDIDTGMGDIAIEESADELKFHVVVADNSANNYHHYLKDGGVFVRA